MSSKHKMTIQEVADEAQVSKTTVSFFLNGKREKMSASTWNRIAAVVEKYDYRPSTTARLMTAKHSCLLGVLVGDITHHFSNRLVKGIAQVCRTGGYQILIGTSDYDEDAERLHIDRMIDMHVDGLILQPNGNPQESIEKLKRAGIPVVCIDSNPEGLPLWVVTNNYQATFDAISSCVDQGYEQVIMFSATPHVLTSRQERYQGCLDALAQKNIPCHVHIIDTQTPTEDILAAVNAHDLTPRTLIFVPNCWLLPNVFTALKPLHSLVPHKLGILGFDNDDWADLTVPTVSTIVQPAFQEGATAAALLIDHIRGRFDTPPKTTLSCETVWRGSTGRV